MTRFYKPGEQAVEWHATKYDECTLAPTGREYRKQEGSGRAEVISRFAGEGKSLGQIAQEAAAHGFKPAFTIDSILKHANGASAAWAIVPPDGKSLQDIKSIRKPRDVSEQVAAKRQAAEEARAAKAAEREAAKAQREQEKAGKVAAREQLRQEREQAKADAKAEKERARAEREATKATAPKKGKQKQAPVEGSDTGEAEAA